MIRRGAFQAWDANGDDTKYANKTVLESEKASGPDDAMAAALAVLTVRERGLDRFLGSTLAFADVGERESYRRVLQVGLAEVEAVLVKDGLL